MNDFPNIITLGFFSFLTYHILSYIYNQYKKDKQDQVAKDLKDSEDPENDDFTW